MSLKSKRICKCCGKEYEYCPHCGSHSDELWKNLTDTKECLAVFNIVAAYNVGRATEDQVKKVLEENNITDYSTFNPGVVATLDKVYKLTENPVFASASEKVVVPEPLIKEAPHVVDIPETELSENKTIEVQNLPRKNRNKKKYRQRNTDIEL